MKPNFLNLFMKEPTPRPSCSDHLGERLLANFRDDRFGCSFLAKIRQQQEQAGEALSRSN